VKNLSNKYNIIDSHAHYDDGAFDEDRDEIIRQINKEGVTAVLNCGSSLKGMRRSYDLAENYDFFYCALGIHPENADEFSEEVAQEIREKSKHKKVKAIGEIGLDYYWDENPSKEIQKDAFRRQMELAQELNLPVVIHDRDAHQDTLDILKEFPEVKGVLHCFSGSPEFAKECIKLGYYLGFTGVVTFKNAKKAVEAAKSIPIDRILVETDCPYMSPEPFRGKRNNSSYIEYIIEKLAEIKEIEPEAANKIFNDNIKRLLKL